MILRLHAGLVVNTENMTHISGDPERDQAVYVHFTDGTSAIISGPALVEFRKTHAAMAVELDRQKRHLDLSA